MDVLRKAIRFSKGEWNRQISSKKLYIVFACLVVVLYFYMGTMPQAIKEFDMTVGILELFPLYWNEFSLPDVLLGGFLLLVCDIPTRGKGMHNYVMRSGKKAYYLGEIIYIIEITVFYLFFIWFVTVLFTVPRINFDLKWSQAIENGEFGVHSVFQATENYLYSGTPVGRFLSCILLVSLCCILMAVICSFANIATGTVIGCAVCGLMLFIDITIRKSFLGNDYPAWTFFFSPITTIQVFSGSISCSLWIAALYYFIGIAIMVILGAFAVKRTDI